MYKTLFYTLVNGNI